MNRRFVLTIILMIFLIGILVVAFEVQMVEAVIGSIAFTLGLMGGLTPQ